MPSALDRLRLPGLRLISGGLGGLMLVIHTTSVAALLFSGDLASYLPSGLAMALCSAAVCCAVVGLRSSLVGALGSLQSASALVLAMMVADAVKRAPPEAALATATACMVLGVLFTGASLHLLGQLRLGRLVRFVPYPVIGGFLAGTGLLLVQKAPEILMGAAPDAAALRGLWADPARSSLGPGLGLVLALALTFAPRRSRHPLLVPGLILAVFASFFVGLRLMDLSLDQASAQGLLLADLLARGVDPQLPVLMALHANLGAVLHAGSSALALALVTSVSLLLNAAAMELATRKDMDMNRELQVAGEANLLAGLLGGFPGFHSISLSALASNLGGASRSSALIAAAAPILALWAGEQLFSWMPRAVVGGLLLYLGLSMLLEWSWDALQRFSRLDFAAVWGIAAVVATQGFLPGVGVGLLVAVVLFALSYGRVDVVRWRLSRAEVRSTVRRQPAQERVLTEAGADLRILGLQGFLFFGTAYTLLQEVRQMMVSTPPRLLILDLRQVLGIDISAAMSLARVGQLCQDKGVVLVWTDVQDKVVRRLAAAGCNLDDQRWTRRFPDLDAGLDWAEESLLAEMGLLLRPEFDPEMSVFPEPELMRKILPWLQTVEVRAGERISRQGEASDGMWFVAQGELTVWIERADGVRVRLARVGPGNTLGEMGHMLSTPRTGSVYADEDVTLLWLSGVAAADMRHSHPELALELQRLALHQVAERLSQANREIARLR